MAALHHHYDRVVIVVTGFGVQLPYIFVGNEAGELVETVSGIVKGRRVGWVGVHPRGELVHWDVDAEVYNVPDEVGRVDLGRVNLDDGPIFSKPAVSDIAIDRGRQRCGG